MSIWLGCQAPLLSPPALVDGCTESLLFTASQTAQGSSLDHMRYTCIGSPSGHQLKWSPFALSEFVNDIAELDGLEQKHSALVGEVVSLGAVRVWTNPYRRWQEARQAIDNEVDALVLRRLLPGQRNLCPE